MPNEMYEEIPLPNGQMVTISKRGKQPVELHLVSRAKFFATLEEAEAYAQKLADEAMRQVSKRDN